MNQALNRSAKDEADHLAVIDGSCGLSASGKPMSVEFLAEFDSIIDGMDIPQYLHDHMTRLRFPEMLLLLLVQAEREAQLNGCEHPQDEACMAWTNNGQAIVIRNKQALIQKLFRIAQFKAKLYSSFTRKLYRWGFRRLRKERAVDATAGIVFIHPLFQRGNKRLMANMKCATAQEAIRGHTMETSSTTTDQRKSSNVASPLASFSGGLHLPPTNDFATPSLPRLDLTLPQACHSVLQASLSSLAERELLISTPTAAEMLSRPAVSHYDRLITDLRLHQRTLMEGCFQLQGPVHLSVPPEQRQTALLQILQRGFEDTSPDRVTLRRVLRAGNSIH